MAAGTLPSAAAGDTASSDSIALYDLANRAPVRISEPIELSGPGNGTVAGGRRRDGGRAESFDRKICGVQSYARLQPLTPSWCWRPGLRRRAVRAMAANCASKCGPHIASLDPGAIPDDPAALGAQRQWMPLVFETLVSLDDHGRPQPWLATSWTHDTARKAWIFQVRKNVKLHDGSTWSPPGGSIAVPDDRPIEQILRELAGARSAVVVKAEDGSLLGTGPFRVARWDAGKSATLVAHDQYWGGRPFLDSISIQMGRSLADQASDFQIGKADAVEIAARDLRAPKQRGTTIASTQPMETVALQFDGGRVTGAGTAGAGAFDRPHRDPQCPSAETRRDFRRAPAAMADRILIPVPGRARSRQGQAARAGASSSDVWLRPAGRGDPADRRAHCRQRE